MNRFLPFTVKILKFYFYSVDVVKQYCLMWECTQKQSFGHLFILLTFCVFVLHKEKFQEAVLCYELITCNIPKLQI